jgi:hypothetical protein
MRHLPAFGGRHGHFLARVVDAEMLRWINFDNLDRLDVVVVVVNVDVAGDGLLDDFEFLRVLGFVRYGGLDGLC